MRVRKLEKPPRRRRARWFLVALATIVTTMIGDVAGASVTTYFSGVRASGSWYAVPGYWSYNTNEVSGQSGATYHAAMFTSNGTQVAFSSGWNYAVTSIWTGAYVSPRCAQTSSGSRNMWCKAYY